MDEGCSKAVRETFCELYEKGLIYKGSRIINWCPHCVTALSDAEVEYQDKPGHLWHMRYPLTDGSGYLVVATTRPETMMGDTGVAVNPNDERYKHLVGKTCILPLMGQEIPIVADEYVEMDFGTGCVKMTPAHDPNDFEVGLRHNLDTIRVLDDNGNKGQRQRQQVRGMDRYEARKAVVADLEALGLMEKIEDYSHNVGTCYRCHNDVGAHHLRPVVREDEPLAEAAIKVVEDGETRFVPDRFAKTYLNWMENVHDWCISRQLWWGHQIPVWYCDDCGHMTVTRDDPDCCEKCGSRKIHRDPDVLDTWFSPHCGLSPPWAGRKDGGPGLLLPHRRAGHRLRHHLLLGGPDDLLRLRADQEAPFHTVFIHGLVRDDKGRKMSKSLGNGIDPLEIADKYGADALRFNLVTGNSPGNDMRFYTERCEAMRNFANKIWNASRFLMMNLTIDACQLPGKLELEDKWILSKLNTAIREITENMDRYELGVAAQKIYDFIWDDYCDWYIELTKTRLQGEDEDSKVRAQQVLCHVLTQMLKLLHPFMPFITEEIWQALPHEGDFLMLSDWPVADAALDFPEEEKAMELIMDAIRGVRTRRSEMNVPPSKKAHLTVATGERDIFVLGVPFLKKLAYASEVTFAQPGTAPEAGSVTVVTHAAQISMPLAELVDLEKEKARMEKELKKNSDELQKLNTKLANPGFVNKAPEHVVKAEQERAVKLTELVAKLEEQLKTM